MLGHHHSSDQFVLPACLTVFIQLLKRVARTSLPDGKFGVLMMPCFPPKYAKPDPRRRGGGLMPSLGLIITDCLCLWARRCDRSGPAPHPACPWGALAHTLALDPFIALGPSRCVWWPHHAIVMTIANGIGNGNESGNGNGNGNGAPPSQLWVFRLVVRWEFAINIFLTHSYTSPSLTSRGGEHFGLLLCTFSPRHVLGNNHTNRKAPKARLLIRDKWDFRVVRPPWPQPSLPPQRLFQSCPVSLSLPFSSNLEPLSHFPLLLSVFKEIEGAAQDKPSPKHEQEVVPISQENCGPNHCLRIQINKSENFQCSSLVPQIRILGDKGTHRPIPRRGPHDPRSRGVSPSLCSDGVAPDFSPQSPEMSPQKSDCLFLRVEKGKKRGTSIPKVRKKGPLTESTLHNR